jgi:DNA polymerase-4
MMSKSTPIVRVRAIVHLDLDAFFAAVEVLKNPDLKKRPVVVGGRPEERGVVASASYPARAYGIRSAMPMSRALVLCPEVVIVPPDHQRYRQVSRQVMAILHKASPLVEQVSVDEAFIDLTEQVSTWDGAIEIARQLQHQVREEVKLSASLGVATNKLVAKVASDRDKPGGLTIVPPGKEAAFLAPLPVRALWGVGPVTAEKLTKIGVITIGQLAQVSETELQARFGSHGLAMARHAHGIDERPVVTVHELKSISQERTFSQDLTDTRVMKQELWAMSQKVAQRLKRADLMAGTVAIKLRYADFSTLSRQMALAVPTDDKEEIYRTARTLFERAWQRGRPVRLLGVAARQLSPPVGQLSLWE